MDDEREFTDKWARDCPKNYQATARKLQFPNSSTAFMASSMAKALGVRSPSHLVSSLLLAIQLYLFEREHISGKPAPESKLGGVQIR